MKLTEEQLKTLNFFTKYLTLKGIDVVEKEIYVDLDGFIESDFVDNDWTDTKGKKLIQSIDSVDELIIDLLREYDVEDKFSDDGGYIRVYFHANERKIRFEGEINILDSRTVESGVDEIDEESDLWEWFTEMRNNGYKRAHVHYAGGGDSGYVENTMDVERLGDSGTKSMATPNFVASYIEGATSSYNWWDNEGGQGDFYFNFVNETIENEQEENFDSTEETHVLNDIKF